MHKELVKTTEVIRVIIQKDGQPQNQPLRAAVNGQNGGQQSEIGTGNQVQQKQPAMGADLQPEEADQHAKMQGNEAGHQAEINTTGLAGPTNLSTVHGADYVMLGAYGEPSCYEEDMHKDDKRKWEKAMMSKMDSLIKNVTWDISAFAQGKEGTSTQIGLSNEGRPIRCFPKCKAHLVAKGFKQERGLTSMRSSHEYSQDEYLRATLFGCQQEHGAYPNELSRRLSSMATCMRTFICNSPVGFELYDDM